MELKLDGPSYGLGVGVSTRGGALRHAVAPKPVGDVELITLTNQTPQRSHNPEPVSCGTADPEVGDPQNGVESAVVLVLGGELQCGERRERGRASGREFVQLGRIEALVGLRCKVVGGRQRPAA